MDLFVIQPTYALHSLLRPNRSIEVSLVVPDHTANGRGDHPGPAVPDMAVKELCDA